MTRHHLALAAGGCAPAAGLAAHTQELTEAGPFDGAIHTLTLIGELSHATAHLFEAEIEQLCGAGIGELTLDLSRLESIDWTGVRVIAFRCGWCRRQGCELVLVPGPTRVQRVFELEGWSERLPFRGTGETAVPNGVDEIAVAGAVIPIRDAGARRRDRRRPRPRSRG